MSWSIHHDPVGVEWPDESSRRWLEPRLGAPTEEAIPNVRAELGVAVRDGVVVPFTKTIADPTNSYVVSPFSHYVAYAAKEIHKVPHVGGQMALRQLVGPVGRWFRRARLDDVVYVNNWLMSTNLWPKVEVGAMAELVDELAGMYPDRAVVLRSVDRLRQPALLSGLVAKGARPVFARRVLYADPLSDAVWKKKCVKIDQKLQKKSPYRRVRGDDWGPVEFARAARLYEQLYIEKYSEYNPRFSGPWLEAMARAGWTFEGLERDGRVDGVLGWYAKDGVMTAPCFGYDTTLPQDLGLYRLLSLAIFEAGRRNGLLCNLSAGVGAFKRHRGAIAVEEYNLVFARHLPLRRQAPWAFLQRMATDVGVPIIEKYDL